MQMMDSIQTCFKKYVDFTGRASRSEYWWFILFSVILQIIASLIHENLMYVVIIALFLPSLSVMIRRLHDSNSSGWWALLLFIPFIGALILLYFMIISGTEGPNNYGPPST